MKRRIIKQGHSTHTITLPAKWIQHHGLVAGDEIELEEQQNNLILRTDKDKTKEKISLHIYGPLKLCRRYLGNAYRKGYDEVEAFYDDQYILDEIHDCLPLFLGYEIINQGKNFCTLKIVAANLDSEFEGMLRRMFLITLSIADQSIEVIKKSEYKHLSNIALLEKTQNKLYNFCSRVVNKKGHKLFEYNTFIYLFIQQLEDVADYYKFICNYLSENPDVKLSKETLALYSEANVMLRNLYEYYYKFDEKKTAYFLDEKERLMKKAQDLFLKKPNKELLIVHHLMGLINNIYMCASPIFSMFH